jgi:hypothetical protein
MNLSQKKRSRIITQARQQKSQEIISMTLISHNQPSEILQPSEKPLDFPAAFTFIPPQLPSVLNCWLRAVAAVRRDHLNAIFFRSFSSSVSLS